MVDVVDLRGGLMGVRSRRVGAVLGGLLLVLLTAVAPAPVVASETCRSLGTGVVECRVSGTGSSGGADSGTRRPTLYLWIGSDGDGEECWYWSSRPGGYDPRDPVDALAISSNLRRLPACSIARDDASLANAAWEVFRSFPLSVPQPELTPHVGIAGLPTFVAVTPPSRLIHAEVLPDGRVLRVDAGVIAVVVDWGDGHRSDHAPAELSGYPSGASHVYRAKTCTSAYRTTHPAGSLCHPSLEAYQLEITFVWAGRYSVGGSWIELGSIGTTATSRHDVDEIVGIRQR